MLEVKTIVLFCLEIGTILFCMCFVVFYLTRWLARNDSRERHLKIAFWVALTTLIIMLCYISGSDTLNIVKSLGEKRLNDVEIAVALQNSSGVLLFAGIGIFFIFVIAFVGWIVYNGSCVLLKKESSTGAIAKEMKRKLKSTAAITLFTAAILLIYPVLPLLVGSTDVSARMADVWINGVIQLAGKGAKKDVANSLIAYTLNYVVVLGVAFAAAKIVYTILRDAMSERDKATLWDEYSSAIGLLTVSISLLWGAQEADFSHGVSFELAARFFETFIFTTVLVALIIVVLEVIRLMLDMRQTLIRREAKIVFIFLVGRMSLFALAVAHSISCALESAVNIQQTEMMEILESMIKKIQENMMDEMNVLEDKYRLMFPPFEEKTTKK